MQDHKVFPIQNEKRVAIYLRTAALDSQRQRVLNLEKKYYQELLHNNTQMQLVKIYCDEGYSGNSQIRPGLNQMIADCEAGKLDLIVTRNVSRFYRNIVESLSLIRKLRMLEKPVGVFFESEGLFTLNVKTSFNVPPRTFYF